MARSQPLKTRTLQSLTHKEKNWLRVRVCGFCEASLLGKTCFALSGEYELPVIEGVRDTPEIVNLGPPCNMDEKRGAALAHYKPRNRRLSPDSRDHNAISARFWAKVDRRGDDECWNWKAAKYVKGYGRFAIFCKPRLATHVVVWLTTGEWPEKGLCVCHHCDNPPCVNPAHLFLGTPEDNHNDKIAKGRQSRLAGERNPRAALTWQDVRHIRSSSEPAKVLAARYGVTPTSIFNARRGATWRQA